MTTVESRAMTTAVLATMKRQAEQVIVTDLKLPELRDFRDRIKTMQAVALHRHAAEVSFQMRREQLKQVGFAEVSVESLVEMLAGGKPVRSVARQDLGLQNHAIYDHHFNKFELRGLYPREYQPGLFSRGVKPVLYGAIDYLKADIPYGVALRLKELQDLRVFNSFCALAPMEAWSKPEYVDPIVVAEVAELPPAFYTNSDQGKRAHYFVAMW